jgi:hypothetical protein
LVYQSRVFMEESLVRLNAILLQKYLGVET